MKIESAKELAVYGAAYKLAMDVFHLTEATPRPARRSLAAAYGPPLMCSLTTGL